MLISRRRCLALGAAAAGLGLAAPAALRAAPRRWAVAIDGFAFSPAELEIAVGDVVVWTNNDLAPHTATELGGAWDTDALRRGDAAELIFRTAGAFTYQCRFHPVMRGRIVVADRGSDAMSVTVADARRCKRRSSAARRLRASG